MAEAALPPAPKGPVVSLPEDAGPILLVVVDTEEEFDWNADFDRNATEVTHMREIFRFQEICDRFGVRPAYMIDYPIATKEESLAVLRPLADEGRAAIGAHLHPWVNPPFTEEVTRRNSYPGNLPAALERQKIAALTEAIAAGFGAPPRAYKAGRYGLGPNTAASLAALGYDCDLSFSPGFDLSADGGPDYSAAASDVAWLDRPDGLLELPATGGFIGHLRGAGARLQQIADHPAGLRLRLGGVLSHSGLMSRIRLSPEGFTLAETKALTRRMLAEGVRILSFTLHSPSAKPGCTPFVGNSEELQAFLQHIREFFHYFLEELGGTAMTPEQVRQYVIAHQRGRAA